MIGHYLLRILDVRNPRNSVVQVLVQDTRNRTVRVGSIWCGGCYVGVFPDGLADPSWSSIVGMNSSLNLPSLIFSL